MTENDNSTHLGFLQAAGLADRAMVASLVDVLVRKGILDDSDRTDVRDGALQSIEDMEGSATPSDKWILDSAKSQILNTFGSKN